MECKVIKPNVTTYQMRFNKQEDPDMYWRCMWARITLDHDGYTLAATSDCGDFQYSWGSSSQETFLQLLCRMGADYLLDKIASMSEFRLDESKKETIESIREYCSDIEGLEDKIQEIEEIDEGGDEYFYRRVDDIMDGEIDFESISLIKDYPLRAKVFCRIFKEYLQPLLKEQLKQDKQ